MPFICKDNKGVGRESIRKNTNYLYFLGLCLFQQVEPVFWYTMECIRPNCVSLLSALPLQPWDLVLFSLSSVHWSMFAKEHGIQHTLNVQQTDSILSSLATQNSSLKMFSQVISGNNIIVMLAHTDHKHKKNCSSTKKINEFCISHIFCIASNLHLSNGRIQMNESTPLHIGSQIVSTAELSGMCIHTNALFSALKLPNV